MKEKRAALILAILGTICILLPLHITMTGVCFLGLAAVLWLLQMIGGKACEKWLRPVLIGLTALAAAVVFGGMLYVGIEGNNDEIPSDGPEFVVVLGAQIHGEQPSLTLKERLDLAKDYLDANPAAAVFVSGGQGADEICTEASVMEQYLLTQGIAEDRIVKEEQASDTRQNLLYSRALADERGIDTDSVVIITSEFHLCRAKYYARAMGMEAFGLGSKTWPWILMVNYELREVFAFVKAIALT